jgi:hypothetical protein
LVFLAIVTILCQKLQTTALSEKRKYSYGNASSGHGYAVLKSGTPLRQAKSTPRTTHATAAEIPSGSAARHTFFFQNSRKGHRRREAGGQPVHPDNITDSIRLQKEEIKSAIANSEVFGKHFSAMRSIRNNVFVTILHLSQTRPFHYRNITTACQAAITYRQVLTLAR